jgi:tripartite-type tricarboxylate transporter receptor subunit TctC
MPSHAPWLSRWGAMEGKIAMIDRRSFSLAALSVLAMPAVSARAAGSGYPAKPVSIITPAPAGVGPDVIARTIASELAQKWNQQVLVINKPGAGGLLGLRAAAEASADGYHFYLPLSSTFVTLPQRFHDLHVDLNRDFIPIALIGEQPMVITANAKTGIGSLPELVALAKARPGKLLYGAPQGSLPHLTGELLKERAGIDLRFVPYSNMREAMQDAVAGTLQVYIESIAGVAGHIKAGTLKGLAVASSQRLPDHPELPTAQESLPQIRSFEARGWFALVAREGTASEILHKVGADLRAVLTENVVEQRFRALGTYVRQMSPAQLAAFIRSEQALWRPVVRRVFHATG